MQTLTNVSLIYLNKYCLYFQKAVTTNTLVTQGKANIVNGTTPVIKSMLDPKRRNELIDEAFLEQKDILLDMLETKLKEVRDKKKKQGGTEHLNGTESNCEPMPTNVDVILKAHGISAIGDTDVRLKYGEDGNGALSLDASGISNVGKVHLELGVVDGNVHIPGLDNVFTGETLLKKKCYNDKEPEMDNESSTISRSNRVELVDQQTRRVDKGKETLDVGVTLNDADKTGSNNVHNSNNNANDRERSSMTDDFERTSSTTIAPVESKITTEIVNETNTLTSDNKCCLNLLNSEASYDARDTITFYCYRDVEESERSLQKAISLHNCVVSVELSTLNILDMFFTTKKTQECCMQLVQLV